MTNEHAADKRTMSTDALDTLGMIITPNEKRDAIHLATEPVVAVDVLQPGQDIGFIVGGVGVCDNPVGIVDPFLTAPVQPGEHFWLIVYPRQITSLRHVWTHPEFKDEQPEIETEEFIAGREEFMKELDGTNAAGRWIESYANSVGLGFDELINSAEEWVASSHNSTWGGEYLNRGELLDGVSLPSEFWIHYQKFTGKVVEPEYQQSFFTCSC